MRAKGRDPEALHGLERGVHHDGEWQRPPFPDVLDHGLQFSIHGGHRCQFAIIVDADRDDLEPVPVRNMSLIESR